MFPLFLGPKQYAYSYVVPQTGEKKTVLKIRGFSKSYGICQQLNFESLKSMVQLMVSGESIDENGNGESRTVKFHQILRKRDHSLVSQTSSKVYKPVNVKRRLLSDYTTLPYGYVDC